MINLAPGMDYQGSSTPSSGPRQPTSPARLASFRPPRDLSLFGVSTDKLKNLVNPPTVNKRVFTPNVNVARRKANACPVAPAVVKEGENKPRQERNKRPAKTKGNFIQTQGIFSDGLSTEKINKFGRVPDSTPQIVKPKLNLARNVSSKKKDDEALNRLMKDDFIDDPNALPDINDPPISLPLYLCAKPLEASVESAFQAIQMKPEKKENFNSNSILNLFKEPTSPGLVVLQFPPEIEYKESTKSGKDAKQEEIVKSQPTNRIANVGEGRWGTLRILENGKAYIAIGDEKIPLELTRNTLRENVMAVEMASSDSRGAVVNLGQVSANFVCSSDLSHPAKQQWFTALLCDKEANNQSVFCSILALRMGDSSEWDNVAPISLQLLRIEENDLFQRRVKRQNNDYDTPDYEITNSSKITTMAAGDMVCSRCSDGFEPHEKIVNSKGELWHLQCFVCAQCFRPFPDGVYYEFEGRKYCEHDFHVLFAPCCGKCGEFIVGRVIKAMNSNWHPKCFRCGVCSKELADRGFFRNSGRALCHECNAQAKAEGSGKFSCHKCHGLIDDKPLRFRGEVYHPYHFNCTSCGTELNSDAREVKNRPGYTANDMNELYCLRCHDKMGIPICGACRRPIEERVVTALGKHWHVEHFVCAKCEKPFLGHRHYEKKGLAYCETHYHQLFGNLCFVCNQVISGDVFTAMNKAWCVHHFACSMCDQKMTQKSKFYEFEMKPVCKKCYEKFPGELRKRVRKAHEFAAKQ